MSLSLGAQNFDLREIESIELVTENTKEPHITIVIRLKKRAPVEFIIPMETWYGIRHNATVRMRMTFPTKVSWRNRFIPNRVYLNLGIFGAEWELRQAM